MFTEVFKTIYYLDNSYYKNNKTYMVFMISNKKNKNRKIITSKFIEQFKMLLYFIIIIFVISTQIFKYIHLKINHPHRYHNCSYYQNHTTLSFNFINDFLAHADR